MNILIITLSILLLLMITYLLCLKPNLGRKQQITPFEQTYIAHRGYFDNDSDCPENSLPAFQKAIKNGYGIELDVQLTKDGKMVVFHDTTLQRMCGVNKKVTDCTYHELKALKLVNTNHSIPLFTEVLQVIHGSVPVIIEIKTKEYDVTLAKKLMELLANYHGSYCIESFHPGMIRWFKKNHPEVIRGLLSTDYKKNKMKIHPILGLILTNLLLNWYAKPDFIAYNHKYANQFSYRICRRLYPVVNAAWTIRNQNELNKAQKIFSIIIFDGFKPHN